MMLNMKSTMVIGDPNKGGQSYLILTWWFGVIDGAALPSARTSAAAKISMKHFTMNYSFSLSLLMRD